MERGWWCHGKVLLCRIHSDHPDCIKLFSPIFSHVKKWSSKLPSSYLAVTTKFLLPTLPDSVSEIQFPVASCGSPNDTILTVSQHMHPSASTSPSILTHPLTPTGPNPSTSPGWLLGNNETVVIVRWLFTRNHFASLSTFVTMLPLFILNLTLHVMVLNSALYSAERLVLWSLCFLCMSLTFCRGFSFPLQVYYTNFRICNSSGFTFRQIKKH
jgi:hypothetical protein